VLLLSVYAGEVAAGARALPLTGGGGVSSRHVCERDGATATAGDDVDVAAARPFAFTQAFVDKHYALVHCSTHGDWTFNFYRRRRP
jgi:hypothetical protein